MKRREVLLSVFLMGAVLMSSSGFAGAAKEAAVTLAVSGMT